jgi:cell wall-associated NlpC family hydrolase
MDSQGIIVGSVANLYREPRGTAELVSQAILGSRVSILESREGWLRVQTPDTYKGWIEQRSVRALAQGETGYAEAGQVAEVRNLLAFLYDEPTVSARAPALQVTIGTRLELVGEQGDWVQVMLPDQGGGNRLLLWMQKGDVTITAAATPRSPGSLQDLVRTARRFLGLPYMWGGCTPLGIDCSGFVQLVYHLHGVTLLRDAHIQYTQPDLVTAERDELRTGDLLFFGSERITHVGMYIEDGPSVPLGAGEFIHATTHKCPIVQISRLAEPHWTDLYWGARRSLEL